jgi:hypothetical protein
LLMGGICGKEVIEREAVFFRKTGFFAKVIR